MELLAGVIAAVVVYLATSVILPSGPVTKQVTLLGAFSVFCSVFMFMVWYIEPVGVGLARRMNAPANTVDRAIEFAVAALVIYAAPYLVRAFQSRLPEGQ